MKAILMTTAGSAEKLHLADIEEPEISLPSEVKIKIKAAGVNPIDTKVRRNGSFYSHPLPIVLGCDGAGEVVAIGDEVSDFKIGDEVWYCHGGLGQEQGNYAEYTVIDQRWLALKPVNSSYVEAAALPLVLITAWGALFEKGGLQAGETVFIQAGAGGVGHVAIQLAKLQGAKVITTVSSEEKSRLLESLGADHVINYRELDVVAEVMRLTADKGVDLVIDTIGGESFVECISIAAYLGRVITLLDPGMVDLSQARMKNLLIGFELMLAPILKQLDTARDKQVEILEQCAQWFEEERLKVHVSMIIPLAQVITAHKHIEQGHSTGKIVLQQ